MIQDIHAGSRIRIFFPTRIPGSNEAPDPGSATLKIREVMSLKMTFASCSSWDIRHGNSDNIAEFAVLRIRCLFDPWIRIRDKFFPDP
jgi:hypothetical protein